MKISIIMKSTLSGILQPYTNDKRYFVARYKNWNGNIDKNTVLDCMDLSMVREAIEYLSTIDTKYYNIVLVVRLKENMDNLGEIKDILCNT